MGSAEVDPYIDPATGILRNLVGAKTREALGTAEGDLVFARLVQLTERPPAGSGDLAELQAIHRELFQDVFDWAGELRTVDIRKQQEGAEPFLPVQMIERASFFAADELRADNYLRGMNEDQFIDRLAYHYDAFNYIHPFREGNGRTQRVMWNRIALEAGWQLDWQRVQGPTNNAACRAASEHQDLGPLREMFAKIVSPAVPELGRDADWRSAELERLSVGGSAPNQPAGDKTRQRVSDRITADVAAAKKRDGRDPDRPPVERGRGR